jgi:hypothetical protein
MAVNWIHLDQDTDKWRALVNMTMNPPSSITGEVCPDMLSVSFSKTTLLHVVNFVKYLPYRKLFHTKETDRNHRPTHILHRA